MSSLRHVLLWTLLLALAAALLAAAAATYGMARAEADQIFDYHLRQLALSLRDQAFRDALDPRSASAGEGFDLVIQVWDKDGGRLYLSHPHAGLPDQARLGFDTIETSAGRWRAFSTSLRDQVIQVAQPLQVRDELAIAAALRTLLPHALLLPLLGLAIWYLVGRGLRPLERLARAVTARSPSALDPLPETGLPLEVRPVVHALNDLLARLDHALAAQRAFVADAAHELRTPLTALQLQVQLAERAHDGAERRAALDELKRGIGRAAHLVQQLLTLARQEPSDVATADTASVHLGELAGLVVADFAPLSDTKGIDLGVDVAPGDVTVTGDREALLTLLANLVDNALRCTPQGGRIDVSAGLEDGHPCIAVSDNGPGIPDSERERVFDRFYRRDAGGATGSGLGLAIVKAVADRHAATVGLGASASGGLLVRIVFPPK